MTARRITASLDWHFLRSRLVRRIWTVPLAALLVFLILVLYGRLLHVPVYTSTATLCVSIPSSPAGAYADLPSTSAMAEQYALVFEDPLMTQRAAACLHQGDFPGTLSASAVSNLNLITLSVTADTAETARDALLAVLEVHPEITGTVFTNAAITVMEAPALAEAPSNEIPAGFFRLVPLAAAAAQLLILCLRSLFSGMILHEADFQQRIPIPLSASVCCRSCEPAQHREDLRRLALKLEYQHRENGRQVFVFLGAQAGEGCTTLASGVEEILTGWDHRVVRLSFASATFSRDLSNARKSADLILIDASAFDPSGAETLAEADTVCFVIRTGHTAAATIVNTLNTCAQLTDAPIFGILNEVHTCSKLSFRKRGAVLCSL